MSGDEETARAAIVAACRALTATGLNQGTSGNISVAHRGRMLITPSAVPADRMEPAMIAALPLAGAGQDWDGPLPPSSEWRFHRALLGARPEMAAVVHAHPPHCTALAIARRPIPACHYMVAAFGGDDVPVAPYARYGTEDLAALAVAALGTRSACLLANHGMIVLGETLERAMWRAVELEALARQFILSLQAGGPVLLDAREIAEARAAFADYGAGR